MIMNPLSPSASEHQSAGPVRDSRFTPIDPMRILRQYTWLLIVSTILSAILGVGLWYGLLKYGPQYTSQAQLTVTGGITDPFQMIQNGTGFSRGMEQIDAFIMNQILRIESQEVLDGALRHKDVMATGWLKSFGDAIEARKNLEANLSALKIRNSTVIHVEFTSKLEADPPVILDAVIGEYLKKRSAETGRVSDNVRLTFVRERDRAQEYVKQVEDQMKQFTLQNDLTAVETMSHETAITYRVLSEQKTQLELVLQSARDAYPAILAAQRAGGGPSPRQLAEAETDREVAISNEQLRGLRTRREVLRERLGDNHPSVRDIDVMVAATEQEKANRIELFIRKIEAVQLEQAKNAINSLEAQLEGMRPAFEANRAHLRDLQLTINEYKRLQVRAAGAAQRQTKAEDLLNSMRIQSDRPDSTQVRVVFNATVAQLSFPKAKIVVPAVMILIVSAVIGFVFLKEALDQRIKSPIDVALLPQCTLLGVIPDSTEDSSNPKQVGGVVRVNPTGLMAESFRQVRTSLLTQIDRYGYKTLLMVGPQPHSGTSVVANNLAMSFAYDGKRVLLLDANYRRPEQHKLFNVAIEPGLVELLAGSASIDQVVAHIDQPNMDVLPVGLAADAWPEMFEGSSFRDLMTQLKDRYDLILIDVPPGLLTSDSCLMAKHVDAVAIVVRAVQDRRGMVRRILRQFDDHGAQILGVILNGVRSSAGGYFRKNYKAFHRYRQSESASRLAPTLEADIDDQLIVDSVSKRSV